jgi:uncharacterized protein YijF (DUF1287 family)
MAALPHHVVGLLAIALMAAPPARAEEFGTRLSKAALERTHTVVLYDGSYRVISYPMGDVPLSRGACTDEVIRAYRALGIDLQQRVHEDMTAHFGAYPHDWGLTQPDKNIDHRRVPNLERFFARHGTRLALSTDPADYHAGDVVTWRLNGKLPHIGIVTEQRAADTGRPLIVHNIGLGPKLEDVLFAFPLFGHYRYRG